MDYALLVGVTLVTGVTLAIVAQWRAWRPTLLLALTVGIGIRVLIMAFAAADTWQPVDFEESFKPAGEAILNREDPVLASEEGWHFLPTIPYMYGLLLWLGIPWEIAGRLVTVAADVALIPLVGKLAGGPDGRLRAFQYACNPLGILVAAVHGQVEPVALAFGVAAFVVARGPGDPHREGLTGTFRDLYRHATEQIATHGLRGFLRRSLAPHPGATRRAVYAGLLMGLALCAKSWPIWLIPGMLLLLPGVRARLAALVATAVPPIFFLVTLPVFAGTRIDQISLVIAAIRHIRPIIGEWGWTAIALCWQDRCGAWTLDAGLASVGTTLIYITLLVVAFLWRRADPVDLTTAMLLAFMVVTPRLGAQYLLWFMPFLVARPTRFAWPVIIGCSTWAAVGYLYLTQWEDHEWWIRHTPWAMSSVVLLPLLVAAMPWNRRVSGPPRNAAVPEGDASPPGTPESPPRRPAASSDRPAG